MDTDSAYSGDGSNTDSGRGPSEEGGENNAYKGNNGVPIVAGSVNGTTDGSSYFV